MYQEIRSLDIRRSYGEAFIDLPFDNSGFTVAYDNAVEMLMCNIIDPQWKGALLYAEHPQIYLL